jgi:hypothetical protein
VRRSLCNWGPSAAANAVESAITTGFCRNDSRERAVHALDEGVYSPA